MDIAPGLIHPVTGKSVREMAAECEAIEIQKIAP
jgi:hypothetical protein